MYANTLYAYNSQRSPDMPGYLFIIAPALQEYSLCAVLSCDLAFRRKAAQSKVTSWSQIDPHLYTRAFTGPGKAKSHATRPVCLKPGHSVNECDLYGGGPVKKGRATQAGPARTAPIIKGREVYINFNRGKCMHEDCPRLHTRPLRGCGGLILLPTPALLSS